MKVIKYILLFSFTLSILALIAKMLFHFRGVNQSLLLSVLILIILIPIYGILTLIKKQHRIEASMMSVSIPLIFGVLFKLMNWPGSSVMIIIGSQIALLFSIGILIYSIVKKYKVPQSALFVTIGFCSFAYCFKILFWPGSKELIVAAFIMIVVALIITIKQGSKLTFSKMVLSLIILLFTLSFVTKESKLYQISHINLSNPESNNPEFYYIYAWKLHNEGDTEKAKANLQHAINELNNPNNEHAKLLPKNSNNFQKTYETALSMLNNNKWHVLE